MKAIRVHEFGGPEVMRLEDVSDPTAGPGQVVIRVNAIGVNPVDALMQGLVWIRKMRGPFYLALPIWLQRALAAVITPIAYAFGYRAVYKRFSGEEW